MQETCAEVQRFREMVKEEEGIGPALDLTEETYESFPFALLELTELRLLRLNYSNLSFIPISINYLKDLNTLDLKHNDFKEFPVAVCELTHLQVLDLSENNIVTIPSDISHLKELKTLNLQNTKLVGNLSEHISHLTSLTHLDVSKNALDSFPESLENLAVLEKLNMWRNAFEEAPSVLTKLTKLKTLDISYNKLVEFELDLSVLKHLEDLDLEGNKLTVFPVSICSLNNLLRLDIGRNKISTIPDNITSLRNLNELWINHNELSSFPMVICKLQSLETLSISYNKIKSVPGDLAYINKLRNLELDSCGLNKFPLSVCMLKNLKWLSVGNNNITSIPIVLTSLHELSYLNLYGNKDLKIPPPTILKRGIETIFNYLEETDNKRTIYQKVIFLGNVKAGKTSLSRTMIQGKSQLMDDTERTVVLDQKSWTPEENLSLQVYDFGGSEIYDVVQHFFIDKHSIVFLVVSLTDYSAERYIDSIEKWLLIIQSRAPEAKLFVVATHADLFPENKVIEAKQEILELMHARESRQVELVEEEIKRLEDLGNEARSTRDNLKKSLSNRLVLPEKVYSVSSKTLQNIEDLKKDLLGNAKELGRMIPSAWQQLYHCLHTSELSKTKNFLTQNDVQQMDKACNQRQTQLPCTPIIQRKKQSHLLTQISVQDDLNRRTKAPVTRKHSEHSQLYSSVFRNAPTVNDEHRLELDRFQVKRLDEECRHEDVFISSDRNRLHDILAFFQSIGDVIWYENNPDIRNFIFHNQSFLIDLLKTIFSERPNELSVSSVASMKQGLTSAALKAARDDLRRRGIMSIKLLKSFLDDSKLGDKMIEAIMQLLVHFGLCFKLNNEEKTDKITQLHFPWFLSELAPEEASAMLKPPFLETESWRFILEYDFPLCCPRALYESMAVHTHRVVSDANSIKHWKDGVYARIRKSKIMIHRTLDAMNVRTISFHVEGEAISDLWSILSDLHKEFRILMTNWPGIMLEMWLVCPHCTKEGVKDPHRFEGVNIERSCPENEDYFTCPKAGRQGSIPANLIFPMQACRGVPSDEALSKIAYLVGSDWRLLGRALGLAECDLEHVNENNQQLYEKAFQMLQKWKRKRGSKAYYTFLINALKTEEMNRNDIVDEIVGHWMI